MQVAHTQRDITRLALTEINYVPYQWGPASLLCCCKGHYRSQLLSVCIHLCSEARIRTCSFPHCLKNLFCMCVTSSMTRKNVANYFCKFTGLSFYADTQNQFYKYIKHISRTMASSTRGWLCNKLTRMVKQLEFFRWSLNGTVLFDQTTLLQGRLEYCFCNY